MAASINSTFKYHIPAEGPRDACIAVVCEKPALEEVARNRLLVGPTGARVRRHLRNAGVDAGDQTSISKEVWLTNAVQNFDFPGANPTDADIIRELPRLYHELTALPNLTTIIGMGSVALRALSNFQFDDIGNRRGSRLQTPFGIKFIPTFHPAFYVRGEWRFAPVVQFDVNRAIKESSWKEIRKTPRIYNTAPSSLTQALHWLQLLRNSALASGYLSFDIETRLGAKGTWYIDCLAFSSTPTEAYCIPLMRWDRTPYWPDISEESLIWREIAATLNLEGVRYVTQNGCAFDQWQLRRHGIKLHQMNKGFDTFSAHSLLAPDLPHDLAFLVSIYTDEEYYKDESGQAEYTRDDNIRWIYNCKDAALTLECAFGIMDDLREA